ncbi:MAG: hypothetical protein V1743_00085 [Nanoarchaeota archaeon]
MLTDKDLERVMDICEAKESCLYPEKKIHDLETEIILQLGERIIERKDVYSAENMNWLARKITNTYYFHSGKQERALGILKALEAQYHIVANLAIADARAYQENQHIDDASPYNPNGFDLLEQFPDKPEVIVYLEEVLRTEYGIPRWQAIETLCKMDTDTARSLLADVMKGNYPSKHFSVSHDISTIRHVKGDAFVELYAK